MPRQVDHEGRRRHIAGAVCELADQHGLEGVTLRDVATQAEVSMGAVQRCFRTKEQMLAFTLGYVSEQVMRRARQRLTQSPAQSARSTLGHTVFEVALLDAEHRAQARVWLAFVAQAAVSERLADILRAGYADAMKLFVRLIADGGVTGDPTRQARRLFALADGLTVQVLVGHLSSAQAHEVLDDHLRSLWDSH